MPDDVVFVDDIPLGATGKIDKKLIRTEVDPASSAPAGYDRDVPYPPCATGSASRIGLGERRTRRANGETRPTLLKMRVK